MREGWKRIRLQNVCDRVTVGHVGKTSAYYCEDGVKFLRTQNVGKNGLKLNDVRFITPEFHRSLKKSQLAAGDVLISRVVTDDMRCAIVPPGLEPANCANIILLRPGSDHNSRYLYHLVNSPYAQRYLLDRRVGSAQQVVNTKVLKDWEIPVPSRGEQEKIVERRETWVALGRPHLFDLGMTQGSHFGLIRYLNSLGPDADGDLELRSLADRWIRWRRRGVIFWLLGPFLMLLDLYFFGSQRL